VRARPVDAHRRVPVSSVNQDLGGGERELEVVAEGRVQPTWESRPAVKSQTAPTAGPSGDDQVGRKSYMDIEEHYCAEQPEYPEAASPVVSALT